MNRLSLIPEAKRFRVVCKGWVKVAAFAAFTAPALFEQ
jgi:hypothetical protein